MPARGSELCAPHPVELRDPLKLDDVVRQLEQGSRIPEISAQQRTLAWIRFFSEVERRDREEPRSELPRRFGAA